ncbi:MAG: trypsin-like serine protease [Gemmatimonadaceae bacterium]
MNFRSAARAVGAAIVLTPAMLSAQSQQVLTFGNANQYTAIVKSMVSAAGNVNTDPRYQTPVSPAYNGVGSIRITSDSGTFICTGSLLKDGVTVLTAAHCLTGGIGNVSAVSVNFYPTNATAEVINAVSWNANPAYSGNVIDENDIGVIRLANAASAGVTRYDLYTGTAENNNFEFVGFGQRGSNGQGVNAPNGGGPNFTLASRRKGQNLFDIALGDSRWDCPVTSQYCDQGVNFWEYVGAAPNFDHVLLTDFDNGTTGPLSNDGLCFLGAALYPQYMSLGTSECNSGLGLNEAISGGGDSGGPGFINGQIASVTSFGLTFGAYSAGPAFPGPYGDINGALDSSFGEYSGFTDVAFQSQWINSQLVATPEPGTTVLMATGLIGIVGMARRRRNKKA